jgi:presenilin-like A22 family membrane protease
MTKKKRTKEQTTVYKTLLRKLKIGFKKQFTISIKTERYIFKLTIFVSFVSCMYYVFLHAYAFYSRINEGTRRPRNKRVEFENTGFECKMVLSFDLRDYKFCILSRHHKYNKCEILKFQNRFSPLSLERYIFKLTIFVSFVSCMYYVFLHAYAFYIVLY